MTRLTIRVDGARNWIGENPNPFPFPQELQPHHGNLQLYEEKYLEYIYIYICMYIYIYMYVCIILFQILITSTIIKPKMD